jgi:sugar phosphate permease
MTASLQDRGDLANAAVAGMSEDLALTAGQLATCVSLFYVGYIVFQFPGDVLLRKITPPIQLGVAMITWGLLTTL